MCLSFSDISSCHDMAEIMQNVALINNQSLISCLNVEVFQWTAVLYFHATKLQRSRNVQCTLHREI